MTSSRTSAKRARRSSSQPISSKSRSECARGSPLSTTAAWSLWAACRSCATWSDRTDNRWSRSSSSSPGAARRTSAPSCVASRNSPIDRVVAGLQVGLLLWRAQLQMFLNQTLRSHKPGRIAGTIVSAAIIVIAWSWEAIITWVGVQASQRAPIQLDTVHLLSLAFLGYTGVLVFSSLLFSLNALLLNPDLDLLLAAPLPVESVLAGRMVVQVLRLLLLSLVFTLPALLVLAFANHNLLIPLLFATLYLLYPVSVVVIISLLSLLLVRFIPVGRGREVVTLFGVILALGINLLNFLFNPALRDSGFARRPGVPASLPDVPVASATWLPSGWAGRSAAAILHGDIAVAVEWALLLLAVSAAIFAAGTILSGRLYLAGWIQAVPPRRRRLPGLRAPRLTGALPLLSPALVAIAAEILIRPGWLWALTAVLLAVAQAVAVTTLMVGIGAVFARFDWTDARRMLNPIGAFIGMGLFAMITGGSALLLAISLALASETRFPVFSTWLAAMTVSIGGAVVVAVLAVLIGNERLRGLELG